MSLFEKTKYKCKDSSPIQEVISTAFDLIDNIGRKSLFSFFSFYILKEQNLYIKWRNWCERIKKA